MTAKPTAQDVLNQFVALKPQITALSGSITGFKGTETLEQALGIHSNILLLKQGIDAINPNVVVRSRLVVSPLSNIELERTSNVQSH
jgi:hypothetical protein